MQRIMQRTAPGPVVIIGTDVPGICTAHIRDAFRLLGRHDAVFGPATDGGYWLVGLRRRPRMPRIFQAVRWSSPHALADTLANLSDRSVARVATLPDVDTAEDFASSAAIAGRRVIGSYTQTGRAHIPDATTRNRARIFSPGPISMRGARTMVHISQQFTPPQLLEAGQRAEVEGRLDLAAQFYRHLTEHFAFTPEAAEARNGLGRVGATQSQVWHLNGATHSNGAAHTNGAARPQRRRAVAPRDHYRTGRALARLVSTLGWLAVICGVMTPAAYLGLDHFAQAATFPRLGLAYVLTGAAGILGTGLLVVFAGQIARAVFDQANAARDLVALERAKFGAD